MKKLRKLRSPHFRWAIWLRVALGLMIVAVVCLGVYNIAHISEAKSKTNISATNQPDGVVGDSLITVGGAKPNITVEGLFNSTNDARKSESLVQLSLNEKLNASAQAKCNDMVAKDYWSHNDPAGQTPWHFFTEAGYYYSVSAENLAYGFTDSAAVLNGWMNSPGHRANILNANYREVGFGVCEGSNYIKHGHQIIVVQHIASPASTSKATQAPSTYKPYTAPVCTKTLIPYQTNYVDDPYLDVGQTTSYGGYDGSTETCTADSTGYKPPDLTIPPLDKTVNVGTRTSSMP